MRNKKEERINEENHNNQGCLMKIIEYNNNNNIVVEFQDKYKTMVRTQYGAFKRGEVKNPYYPAVCGIGIVGNKYPVRENNKVVKEYVAWHNMIKRCYYEKYHEKQATYKEAMCCKEWLFYENFYEWLHNQDNFDMWHDGDRWAIDKDIIKKGNKVYSPEYCCLVPQNVNSLFVKGNKSRGVLPIGVTRHKNKFAAQCQNQITGELEVLVTHNTPEEAFQTYKKYKENIIKQVAEVEFNKRNITIECYNAMMSYQVDITD